MPKVQSMHSTGSSSAAELQFMVEALIYLATNASREIFISVLDPYALFWTTLGSDSLPVSLQLAVCRSALRPLETDTTLKTSAHPSICKDTDTLLL